MKWPWSRKDKPQDLDIYIGKEYRVDFADLTLYYKIDHYQISDGTVHLVLVRTADR